MLIVDVAEEAAAKSRGAHGMGVRCSAGLLNLGLVGEEKSFSRANWHPLNLTLFISFLCFPIASAFGGQPGATCSLNQGCLPHFRIATGSQRHWVPSMKRAREDGGQGMPAKKPAG